MSDACFSMLHGRPISLRCTQQLTICYRGGLWGRPPLRQCTRFSGAYELMMSLDPRGSLHRNDCLVRALSRNLEYLRRSPFCSIPATFFGLAVNQGHGNDVLVEYKHQVLTPEPLYLVRGCSLCERIMRSNPSSEITGVSLGPWQPAPSRTADFVDVLQYSTTTYMTTTSSPFVWSEQACRSCRRAECSMCNIKE